MRVLAQPPFQTEARGHRSVGGATLSGLRFAVGDVE
jgi:hypothetical protein